MCKQNQVTYQHLIGSSRSFQPLSSRSPASLQWNGWSRKLQVRALWQQLRNSIGVIQILHTSLVVEAASVFRAQTETCKTNKNKASTLSILEHQRKTWPDWKKQTMIATRSQTAIVPMGPQSHKAHEPAGGPIRKWRWYGLCSQCWLETNLLSLPSISFSYLLLLPWASRKQNPFKHPRRIRQALNADTCYFPFRFQAYMRFMMVFLVVVASAGYCEVSQLRLRTDAFMVRLPLFLACLSRSNLFLKHSSQRCWPCKLRCRASCGTWRPGWRNMSPNKEKACDIHEDVPQLVARHTSVTLLLCYDCVDCLSMSPMWCNVACRLLAVPMRTCSEADLSLNVTVGLNVIVMFAIILQTLILFS